MRSLLMILSRSDHEAWAQAVVSASGTNSPLILIATPAEAAQHIAQTHFSPSHIVLDIGARGSDVLGEIDALAQQCEAGTRVVVVGDTNDIHLYREMIARGVIDYVPMPADVAAIINALRAPVVVPAAVVALSPVPTSGGTKRVMVFMSAASGDGASTAALNAAYAISQLANGNTVLVDMDYQFGMVAKHLGLQNQYGIRDLFDHPERGVDATLLTRMVANYGKLHVITAPSELRYLPNVSADTIRELIATLKQNYDNVIIDLPHVWMPWVTAAIGQSTHLVLVAQLWLKSVAHAARMIRAMRELGVGADRVIAVINRSGAKFKEAIEDKDFERVCNVPIRHTLSNDIKTIVTAEATATTIMQLPPSELAADISRLVYTLTGMGPTDSVVAPKRSGLFSKR